MTSEQSQKNQGKPSSFHIIVNARPREVEGPQISYAQVVNLAFPNNQNSEQLLFSVHYVAPHLPDGTLVEDQSVSLENGIKFVVTKTNRS